MWNSNMKKAFIVAFSSAMLVQEVFAGAVCFKECAVVCCMSGPAAFARMFNIVLGVTGCAGLCMVACASGSFIPPACFSENVQVTLL